MSHLFLFIVLLALLPGDAPAPPNSPDPAESVESIDGLVIETWATDPLLEDPVAFCIDGKGRVFVAETARQERGVEDTRSQSYWNLDDIALQTVEDRLAMYEKWAHKRSNGMDHYTEWEDRIRLVVDTDGDGQADASNVYSGGYNGVLEGTGSGVLAHGGDLYYTNIPNLWRLRDVDGDGIAEVKESLLDGFGVRIALRGHDMHGLTWGPDGRLYWSIGDRGYNVTSQEGVRLSDPTAGAVFRCDPDGSNLEVFHAGLRNPQELAFDNYGTLFTGDNNSDGGDRARLVHVAEGGETGWRMEYQTLAGVNLRGPWNQEGIWHRRHEHQPAWVLPPVAHISSGPSGLVHYPGIGLDERYKDHFFLCDFTGTPKWSRVLSFAVDPSGAGYEVTDLHPFVSNVLCTDVDFGYDGRMYISDWVEGWECNENGRIFTVHDPRHVDDPRIDETNRLFASGFDGLDEDMLAELLVHPDQRVRLHAQFTLAHRGDASIPVFQSVVSNPENQLARLHAIWGLGMIARDTMIEPGDSNHPMEFVRPLLMDEDREVRGQAAKVIGEARYQPASEDIVALVFDPEPRVVYHATMAVGRMGNLDGLDAITEMLWENDNRDVLLRHAGVMALTWLDDREALLELARDDFSAVRLAVLLALRRNADSAIEGFLMDPDPFIAAEAARAINDLPIEPSMPALLERLDDYRVMDDGEVAPTMYDIEVWENVDGVSREALATHEAFDRPPDQAGRSPVLRAPPNRGRTFLQRISGVIEPTVSGPHVFFLTADDRAELYLGSDETPGSMRTIAYVDEAVDPSDWDSRPGQHSEPIDLVAGQRYWIEARHWEGGRGDHLAIGWEGPGELAERPVGASIENPEKVAILRRALNAAIQSGRPEDAMAVGDVAMHRGNPPSMRREALAVLADWEEPSVRDRVNGAYRPVPETERDIDAWHKALARTLPLLIDDDDPELSTRARELAATEGIALDDTATWNMLADPNARSRDRIACLRQLDRSEERRAEAIQIGLESTDPGLHGEALLLLSRRDPDAAIEIMRIDLVDGSVRTQQEAIRVLGTMHVHAADYLLVDLLGKVGEGAVDVPVDLHVDVIEASLGRENSSFDLLLSLYMNPEHNPKGMYKSSYQGGDGEKGRELVLYHPVAACMRCHVIDGHGGTAGPDLSTVGARLDRQALLDSIINPADVIAEGYGDVSAMPVVTEYLDPRQVRDIVEYLANRR